MNSDSNSNALDLVVVMPVYNEEACVAQVLDSWLAMLKQLNVRFKLLVLNDGSKDNTAQVLTAIKDAHVEVVNKRNSGHGPTILMGYQRAVEQAQWVFQVDSDNEMSPEHFHLLWDRKDDFDFIYGVRTRRSQNLARKVISACSRQAVWLLIGRGVKDVNVPYRLMRAELLKNLLPCILPDTFAPNIVISGLNAHMRSRILNIDVPHINRQTGMVSIMKWRLWKCAFKVFFQTVSISFKPKPMLADTKQSK